MFKVKGYAMKKLTILIMILLSVTAFAQVDDKTTYESIFDLAAQSKNILQWKGDGLIDVEKADSVLKMYEAEILSLLNDSPKGTPVDTEKILVELESLLKTAPTYCIKAKLPVFKKRLANIISMFQVSAR